MRSLRFFFTVALSAALAVPIGSAIAAGPAPHSVLLKPGMLVNLNQVPRPPRGGKATALHYLYANPAMVGRIKAALAKGEGPYKSSSNGKGGGHGGPSPTPTPVPPPPPPPVSLNPITPTTGKTFAGLGMLDGGGYEPPDAIVTAGVDGANNSTVVLEAVNLDAQVFDTSGNPLGGGIPISAFTPDYLTDSVSDPRVMYDAATGRWFISLITFSPTSDAGWNLAVSATSDPTTGNWVFFYLPTGGVTNPDGSVGNFPDFPKMGFNGDKVVLTGDAFSTVQKGPFNSSYKYQGTEFFVINKSELVQAADAVYQNSLNPVNGFQAPPVCVTFFPPAQGAVAIEPAENLPPDSTSAGPLYMAAVDSSVSSTQTLDIWTVTGNAVASGGSCSGTASASLQTLGINKLSIPPNAQQEGTSTLIDTNDDSLLDAMFRPSDSTGVTGTLWVSGNDACTPSGDSTTRSCAHFIEVNIGSASMSVAQDFDFGLPGYYFYYPAVRTDSSGGDVVTVFSGSSSTSFASVYAGMQKGTTGALDYFGLIAPGNFQYTLSPARWGDYSGASTDPTDSTIWIAGEYSTDYPFFGSIWGTWMANIDPSVQ